MLERKKLRSFIGEKRHQWRNVQIFITILLSTKRVEITCMNNILVKFSCKQHTGCDG